MVRREAAFQARFGRWLQYAYTGPTAAFELKRTLLRSLPLAEIKAHQRLGLSQARTGLYHKLSDESRSQKPFDCFFLKDELGFVCIAYGSRLVGFYMIPEDRIEKLVRDGEISVKEDTAKSIGTFHHLSSNSDSRLS